MTDPGITAVAAATRATTDSSDRRADVAGILHGMNDGSVNSTSRRTTAAIRSAALELALRDGADKVTVDQIAAAAGVSRRTVFNHFETKYDAFMPEVADYAEHSLNDFAMSRQPDLVLALGDLIGNRIDQVQFTGDQIRAVRKLALDSPGLHNAMRGRSGALDARLQSAVMRRLDSTPDDPRTTMTLALARSIWRTTLDAWLAGPDEDVGQSSLRKCLAESMDTLLALVRPTAAGSASHDD